MNMLLQLYPGDAWALLTVNVLVQITFVVVVARLLARLGNRWNAAWRHSLYLIALACVLASPVLAWTMQAAKIAVVTLPASRPAAESVVQRAANPVETLAQVERTEQASPREVPSQTPPTDMTITVASNDSAIASQTQPVDEAVILAPGDVLRVFGVVAVAVWLVGIALLLARWRHGLRLVATLRREARPLDHEAVAGVLDQVRQTLGVNQLPRLAISSHVERPIMIGLIRPMVILPEELPDALSESKLADVLVHECAHAVCRHQLAGFFQRLAGTCFWPHPLVHLLNRELVRAREEVCDNFVLRRGNAARYARTLLELSQSPATFSPEPAALGLFHCRWRLEDRVADLLDRRRKTMIRVNRVTAVALAAVFLMLTLSIAGTRVVRAESTAAASSAADEKTITITAKVTATTEDEDTDKPATPPAKDAEPKNAKAKKPVLSKAEKKNIDRWKTSTWRMSIDLDMPDLDPQAVQYAIFDKDPVPGFIAGLKRTRSFGLRQLATAPDEAQENQIRAIQMQVHWNSEFSKVTGDRLYMLMKRSGGYSSTTMSSNGPAGKKWVVTKARLVGGKALCWCIPVEVETGKSVDVVFNKDNTFDLTPLYDRAMRKPPKTVGEQQMRKFVDRTLRENKPEITARETMHWGKPVGESDGTTSIRCKYLAKFEGGETKIMNQIFTFTPDGELVSKKDVEGFPKKW